MVKNSVSKVLIADDHGVMQDGLVFLLSRQKDIKVIGQAYSGQEAVKMAEELLPDIIIMDVNMPGMDGITAAEHIMGKYKNIKILFLSAYSHKDVFDRVMKCDVSGFMVKDSTFDELAEGIRTVKDDRYYVCSRTREMLADNFVHSLQRESDEGLSKREYDVVRLLADGKNSKEIGRELGVSYKTVDACRREVMRKLNLESLADLVKYAIRRGISPL